MTKKTPVRSGQTLTVKTFCMRCYLLEREEGSTFGKRSMMHRSVIYLLSELTITKPVEHKELVFYYYTTRLLHNKCSISLAVKFRELMRFSSPNTTA